MENLTLEEALSQISNYIHPIEETESLHIVSSAGRILAEDIFADFDIPGFDRSPLDGYAFCSADISPATSKDAPSSLKVIELIMPGTPPTKKLERGQCAQIMTGAMIPEGADCVIRQEDTDYGEETVQIYRPVKAYSNYCYAGEDMRKGNLVMKAGDKITDLHQGILASLGRTQVKVYVRPLLGLITTGSELILPGMPLRDGAIYNSNLYLLAARLNKLGYPPTVIKHVPDSAESCAACIQSAIDEGVRFIITTGGVSVGKSDILHETLDLLHANRIFWRLNFKPGSPALFSVHNDVPILSLSGNPFGAYATFELLARPALEQLARDPSLKGLRKKAVLSTSFTKVSKNRRFLRGCYFEGTVSLPETKRHSSGILNSGLGCNCLLDIPAGSPALQAGDAVEIIQF